MKDHLAHRKNKTSKIRVGVLRGGPSGEHDVSLKTGATVLEHLGNKYHPVDIYIDENGKWHFDGMIQEPENILKHLDVVFNGLHGEYGEDGKLQKILEAHNVPYTGSDSFSSSVAMNKDLSKKVFIREGIKTARGATLNKNKTNYLEIFEIFNTLNKPLVTKPATSGSSLGVRISNTFEEFKGAIEYAFKYSSQVLVEEFVKGREVTCGVVDSLDDGSVFPLPPVEIKPVGSEFFDYEAKYGGKTQEICPAQLPPNITKNVQDIALQAHKALGLRHYSRTDMILSDNGEIYILEVNTLPGLTTESLLPKSLKAAGTSLGEFLDHVIILALNK
ncbi:MAG: D-alanine--D-alanine ligase [Patescibacteria group bacterium]